ncbi:MAG: LmbE family N-acetylglucosaminyl deacetylase [Verrucomicrobiales bacterium]
MSISDFTSNTNADLFVPDRKLDDEALARTTHLAIGAHSDDLEIMAYHGISECYGEPDRWFTGITCTDGAGSSRLGPYASYNDLEMIEVRKEEQRQAAMVGKYGAMLQFCHPSSNVMTPESTVLEDDLMKVFAKAQPRIVYTHNPADKHSTHIGVLKASIRALRRLPEERRPKKVYGCEVWRDLDWMPDEDKIALDVSDRENLANALVGVFDSQITGGKRYDRAAVGRRYANATFFYATQSDRIEQVTFAMDLTPLMHDESLSIVDHVQQYLDKFSNDVRSKLTRWFEPDGI